MTSTQLWLIRHGQTEWSQARRHTGLTDMPLTEAGEQAAIALGTELASREFGLVLSSPLQRAWRTAELAGLEPRVEPLAVECDYGDFEGLTRTEIHAKDPEWKLWRDAFPGGESMDQVGARADEVIHRVMASELDTVVLVSHAHFLRVLAARWIGQPAALAEHLILDPTGVCVLDHDRGSAVIRTWNV